MAKTTKKTSAKDLIKNTVAAEPKNTSAENAKLEAQGFVIKNDKVYVTKDGRKPIIRPQVINGEDRHVIFDANNFDENGKPALISDGNKRGFKTREAAIRSLGLGLENKPKKFDPNTLSVGPHPEKEGRFAILHEDGTVQSAAGDKGFKTEEAAQRSLDQMRNPNAFVGAKRKYKADELEVKAHHEKEGRFGVYAKDSGDLVRDADGKGYLTEESATASITGEKVAKPAKENPYTFTMEDLEFIEQPVATDELTK